MSESLGAVLAERMIAGLRERAASFHAAHGRPATLAVIASGDAANTRFVEIKQRRFRESGLELRAVFVEAAAVTTDVVAHVRALNDDAGVDGIFLQFPLPAGVDGGEAGDAIEPRKDIDTAGSVNLGRLLAGAPLYLPAAPASVIALLESALESLRGRSIVIVGEDGVVERCVMLLGFSRGATLCLLDPASPVLPDAAAGADAVVITGELPPADALRNIRKESVLLDAAYFLPRRPQGWLSERVRDRVGVYLPQFNNVGPLTVAHLMESLLK